MLPCTRCSLLFYSIILAAILEKMKIIGITVPVKASGLRNTLDVLAELFKVRFEERSLGDDAGLAAWILSDVDSEIQRSLYRSNCPCYAVIRNDQLISCGSSSTIEFSRHDVLPTLLSGRQVDVDDAVDLKSLPMQLKDADALALKAGAPIWAIEEVNGQQHHYVSLQIPKLRDEEALFQHFHGQRFLQLLPLIVFLRSLSEEQGWKQLPLHACFMFDDPNLHWRTYGYVDFAQIAAHAKIHNYHACFAMVPLDTWFIHKPTALLFQERRDQISLLIHGNDHIAQELARPGSDEEVTKNLRQALKRIENFERRSGVEVSKVMAPPHGACLERTLGEMARLGFEAAAISRGSIFHFNKQAARLRTVGMKSSDIIRGLPVFPRFRISTACHNNILIAALLGQPIILVGHHHDLADGLQLLADLARFINSLGPVSWADMKTISRSHYGQKVEGNVLRIRMLTKRIEVCVPEGTNQIRVDRPWQSGGAPMPLMWKRLDVDTAWKPQPNGQPIPVLPGQKIEIVSEPTMPLGDVKGPRGLRLWPLVRRQLTEARDRLTPLKRRVSAFTSAK